MTKNVTLRMDEELLSELRHRAVDEKMSLSGWITATLKVMAKPSHELQEVRTGAIRRMEKGFHLGNKPLSREEIYVR